MKWTWPRTADSQWVIGWPSTGEEGEHIQVCACLLHGCSPKIESPWEGEKDVSEYPYVTQVTR